MKLLHPYLRLGVGLLLIAGFLLVLHLITPYSQATRQLHERTVAGDIDNSSLFYTESERAGQAAFAVRKKQEACE